MSEKSIKDIIDDILLLIKLKFIDILDHVKNIIPVTTSDYIVLFWCVSLLITVFYGIRFFKMEYTFLHNKKNN